jgi:hypothetical protein
MTKKKTSVGLLINLTIDQSHQSASPCVLPGNETRTGLDRQIHQTTGGKVLIDVSPKR